MKASFFAVALLWVGAAAAATEAERLLEARQAEFAQEVIEVAEGVYTAVGFGVSTSSMIVGDDGLVIIDAQIDEAAAQGALAAFRELSDKPVRAIVLTHGHGDHTGGVGVFAGEDDPQIWAREGFGSEGRWQADAGLTIQRQRGARQAGFLLKPEQRINNGVAQAYWPKRAGGVFASQNRPTHFFTGDRHTLSVAGVRLELVAADGETSDQLYAWLPDRKVLFAGDNFYKSWPNLYAIRGTGYRDVRAWIDSLSRMIEERPHHLVAGHTRPVIGAAQATEVLTHYRDGIASIFEQTIAGMNRGLTPDELVQTVKLPPELAELDYLKPYYGNAEWAVRAIFTGYLGWFDGNPSNLFPLSPADEARRIAALAGGVEALRTAALAALTADPQWTAQLCDRLLALNRDDAAAMRLKADALDALARELLTATGRNYYMTTAQQLRQAADRVPTSSDSGSAGS
ncbi:MAG: alkyl/aryl-sulfatase [Gammaproteobacteria bacterium]|nr:alkyl/aryl-sulfatase [Gammaproteobacteria bacterium]